MKVYSINTINPNFSFQKKEKNTGEKNTNHLLTGSIVLATVSIGALAFLHLNNNQFINQLAKDLSKELGKNVSPKQLSSIMTKKELLKEMSLMKEQNFIASAENIKNGTFLADLHSHSCYSDGTIKVKDLLDQAAEYGNKLNKINGKKFIFALSDHDGIKGVEEALKLIAQNPNKYKNIKFVPAAEMSFIMPCQEGSQRFKRYNSIIEMPEVLIYDINPFSKNTKDFFDGIYNKRLQGVKDAIADAKKIYPEGNFSFEEYTKFYNPKKKYCFLNQHWKIWNYIHTKSRFAEIAKEQNKNVDILYAEHFHKIKKYDRDVHPYSLEKYLKGENIKTQSTQINPLFGDEFKKKFFPQKKNDLEAFSPYELTFDDIVKYAKKENAIMGFAHPGFTMQNFLEEDILSQMKELVKRSDGQLKLVEKYHQAYPIGKNISEEELAKYNKIIDQLNLIKIGGRDNHKPNFIDI